MCSYQSYTVHLIAYRCKSYKGKHANKGERIHDGTTTMPTPLRSIRIPVSNVPVCQSRITPTCAGSQYQMPHTKDTRISLASDNWLRIGIRSFHVKVHGPRLGRSRNLTKPKSKMRYFSICLWHRAPFNCIRTAYTSGIGEENCIPSGRRDATFKLSYVSAAKAAWWFIVSRAGKSHNHSQPPPKMKIILLFLDMHYED